MPRLLATIPEDGWALVREGGVIYFVRPPFRKSERIPVSEATLADAVAVHGYESRDDAPDEPWLDVVERIHASMTRLNANTSLPSNADMLSRLVSSGPQSVLTGLLDTIERQWLVKGELRIAQRALAALNAADRVKDDKQLLQRTSILLQRLLELYDEKESRVPRRERPARIDLASERPWVAAYKAKQRRFGAAWMVGAEA
jgi:hypothetical protein